MALIKSTVNYFDCPSQKLLDVLRFFQAFALTAITKSGQLCIFEHQLNGLVKPNFQSQKSIGNSQLLYKILDLALLT